MSTVTSNPARLKLIAPCGLNCGVCRAHLRVNKPCPGCRGDDTGKPKTCVQCKIKTCERLARGTARYCFGCDIFPCATLARLDKRYRTRYGTSAMDNLLSIQKIGVRKFVESETRKWTCPECGGTLCMHEPQCPACGYAWHS